MLRKLDPQAEEVLVVTRAIDATPIPELSVADARARMRQALARAKGPALTSVKDIAISTPRTPLVLRVYRPAEGKLPAALFLHGGGWTLNDLDTHDALCRRLCKRSGWLVAALDFRRAPEHKHPAALCDAWTAYRWLVDDASRIGARPGGVALIGESSGATTAAALSLLLRDRGTPMPAFQLLAYPLLDQPGRRPSYAEHGSGYLLDRQQVEWFLSHYLPPRFNPADPYLFPMRARSLRGLPSTLVMTAEFDPLRSEGEEFVRRLKDADVAVQHIHAHDQMHGFLLLGSAIPRAGELVDAAADALAARTRIGQ